MHLLLILVPFAFSLWASIWVKTTFNKYSEKSSTGGITGAQASKMLLERNGVYDVRIEKTSGKLSDHFDPKHKVIRLSEEVYSGSSPASVGVACHEAGHALQYAKGYFPIKLRAAIIPVTNIGSQLALPLIILGMILSEYSLKYYNLVYVGIICFALVAFFQLVTLPTEFNASRRAVECILQYNILNESETAKTKKVLTAAALTYVAALAASLAQVLRLLLIFGGRRRD